MVFNITDYTEKLLIAMFFYSIAITSLSYAMPSDALQYVTSFSDVTEQINLNQTANQIQNAVDQQTSIPVIELGALVFYSGNIFLDFLLNFLYALPQMFGLILNGIFSIVNIDSTIANLFQISLSVVLTALYFLGILYFILGYRSGSTSGFT